MQKLIINTNYGPVTINVDVDEIAAWQPEYTRLQVEIEFPDGVMADTFKNRSLEMSGHPDLKATWTGWTDKLAEM